MSKYRSLDRPEINRSSEKEDFYSTPSSRVFPETSPAKRTIQVPELVRNMDANKVIFPRGIVTTITELENDLPPVKRIELFAREAKETYGILRTLFVALSGERSILRMASASDGIIQVRTLSENLDVKNKIREDKILIKRTTSTSEDENQSLRIKTPNIEVSARWRERMHLKAHDRIILSNPLEEYAVPPPNV